MADTKIGSAFTTNAQLFDLLKTVDNALGGRDQLSGNLEAYKATIDMQAMIALYAKQNIQRLRTERGEDPQHGPSAVVSNPQFWKDVADSKTWAISNPLAEFFSQTSRNNHSENHWSEMETWGDWNPIPKSFFTSLKDEWIQLQGVGKALEEVVQEFVRTMADEKLEDASQENSPQAQQCISISNIDEKRISGASNPQDEANVSYRPTVSVLYVEIQLKSWQMLKKTESGVGSGGNAGNGNQGEKIRAEIRVSQSNLEAELNLEAIRRSKDHLDATRKRMVDLGLDEFENALTPA